MNRRTGFILITGLLLTSLLATLIGAGVLRSTSALQDVERTLALQQAFYLAEAGLDAKLAMLKANPGDTAPTLLPAGVSGFGVTVALRDRERRRPAGPSVEGWRRRGMGREKPLPRIPRH